MVGGGSARRHVVASSATQAGKPTGVPVAAAQPTTTARPSTDTAEVTVASPNRSVSTPASCHPARTGSTSGTGAGPISVGAGVGVSAGAGRSHQSWAAATPSVLTRATTARVPAAAAGTLAVVALVSTLGVAAAQDWWERPAPADTPTPAPTEIGPAPVPEVEPVLAGWQDAGVDPDLFGDATVTSAVSVDGRVVVVGCAPATGTPVGFPAWVADDATTWRRADPPPTIAFDQLGECLRDVVATPYGLFAHGFGLYHSADGEAWEQVSLDSALAAPGTFVMAVFAVGDRVTVLGARATDEGAVVSTLVSTTDGVTWTEVTRDLAAVFDDASVVDVVSIGVGLLAVGSRNLGTTEAERGTAMAASAWVSTDGLTWALVTPEGPGFD